MSYITIKSSQLFFIVGVFPLFRKHWAGIYGYASAAYSLKLLDDAMTGVWKWLISRNHKSEFVFKTAPKLLSKIFPMLDFLFKNKSAWFSMYL